MIHSDLLVEIQGAALRAEASGFVKTAEALFDLEEQVRKYAGQSAMFVSESTGTPPAESSYPQGHLRLNSPDDKY